MGKDNERDNSEINAEAAAKAAEEIIEEAMAKEAEESEANAGTDEAADGANADEGEEKGESKEATELEQLKDKYIRQVAEFDNFRKRTEKEKSAMFDMGAMNVLNKLLTTVDNFERGLKDAPEDGFAEGMKMVYKELMKNLEDIGVKPIEAVGKEFDPNLHNAVMHEEDDSGEENIVTEELQKGYMFKDHVLRYSMVKVKN